MLYHAVKSDPATAKLPVIGPSVVVPAAAAALGDLSADLDYGNIHPYYGPNDPGNPGTGSITPLGRSGSTAYYMNVGAQISGRKPMIVSETGFGTENVGNGNVSELCDGKEEPRTYFEHFKSGIARSLVYQFVESGTAYGALGSFSYMGMLRQNLTPKPSYTAIRSLIALLSDKGVPFGPATLTYRIRGNVNNLHHLLLEKRTGTFYLALWQEVPSWNPLTNKDINATPQIISVDVPATVGSGLLYRLDNTGNLIASSVPAVQGTFRSALRIASRFSRSTPERGTTSRTSAFTGHVVTFAFSFAGGARPHIDSWFARFSCCCCNGVLFARRRRPHAGRRDRREECRCVR